MNAYRTLLLLLLIASFAVAQPNCNDSSFVAVTSNNDKILFDLKYATSDNFLNESVYDCNTCFLRFEAASALKKAAQKAMRKFNVRLKVFDCYRPLEVQYKMFALVSNPDYVADPKKGSVHNRGAAVDLTLVDSNGIELDMGTNFDHFGIEAAAGYDGLTPVQVENRRKLLQIMKAAGFKPLPSEWWHFNYGKSKKFKLSNAKLCKTNPVENKVEIN